MDGAIPGWGYDINSGNHWLTLFTFAPVLGMLIILFMPKGTESKMKFVASFFSAIPLGLGLFLWSRFNTQTDGIQFYEHHHWFTIGNFEVNYDMGVDGLSMSMLILSGLVGFLSTFIHYQTIKMGERGYYALLLLLLTGMNGVFCSLDFFLFFIFWEVMLLPMYFLIGVWGGPERLYAAIKFFLYTMAGSVLILVAMLALWFYSDGSNTLDRNGDVKTGPVQNATAVAYWNAHARDTDQSVYITDADAAKFQPVKLSMLGLNEGQEQLYRIQFDLAPADPKTPGKRLVNLVIFNAKGVAFKTEPVMMGNLAEFRHHRRMRLAQLHRAAALEPLASADQADLDLDATSPDNIAVSPLKIMYAASQVPDNRGETFHLNRTLNLMELKARFELFNTTFHLPVAGAISFANLMFLFLFIGFAIKVPVFPFHTWLPWAHVEAPTAISVILAGILLKMGVYGMLRMNYGMFPTAAMYFAVPIGILGVINILYGAFCALAQKDMKKLVAYSSVSHMGYCMLGLAAVTSFGITGAVLQMFNHGTATSMMFMLVGVVYDRAHHRRINGFGGIAKVMPRYTAFMTLTLFASMGLPSLSGFISEAAVFLGSFMSPAGNDLPGVNRFLGMTVSFQTLTIISAFGVVVTAAYLLWMMQRVFFGPLNPEYGPGGHHELSDINAREMFQLAPLVVLCIFFGVYPTPLIDLCQASCISLQNHIFAANGLAQYLTYH